jgi:AbrB family looped-hinge helix DNA binding protein
MSGPLIAVNAQGRVTLPAEVRRKLRLGEGDRLEVSVEGDRITLRPARVLVAEDAWAYSAESLGSIRRGLDDIREGRVYQTSEADLMAGRYPRRKSRPARRGSR